MCGNPAASASTSTGSIALGKRIYKRRKETVERSFADAKQLHGHRYARMRGLVPGPVLPTRIRGGLFSNLLIPDILHFNSSEIKILPSSLDLSDLFRRS